MVTQSPPEAPAGLLQPPAPVIVVAPSRELGYAAGSALSASDWWGALADERVPELRWPQAYDVYDQMMDDPQVSSVLNAVIMPILRTGWRLDGTDCREDITRHVADDLALPIVGEGNKLSDTSVVERFNWSEHLAGALPEYCGYGHSFYEQKAEWRDGAWHLAKLGYRPPRTISKINVARDGGLVSLEQSPGGPTGVVSAGPSSPIALPVRRIVVYSRSRRGANWRGRSMLRPAYQPWLLAQRAARVEAIVAERSGAPVYVYEAAEKETDLTAGETIARSVRAGTVAGAAIPHGAKLTPQGISGSLPDINKTIQRHNEAIARAVLAHFLNLGTQTGSWALGATFADFFTLALQATADEVARTGSRHIVRDIVNWNWPGERAPRLVFDEIGSRQNTIIAAIAQLVSSGVLQPDEDLEQFTRTTLGLPPRNPTRPTQPTQPQEAS